METKKFKKIIKENLAGLSVADQLNAVSAACESQQGVNICDMLDKDMAQKLIDAGEILRSFPDRQFTPRDIEYMTRLIAVAKREFGADNQEVLDFESSIKKIMDISGDISAAEEMELAMESLRGEFTKFKLI